MKIIFLLTLTLGLTASADQKPLTYEGTFAIVNLKKNPSVLYSEFAGKFQVGNKKVKILRRDYLVANAELVIHGTNPLSDFEMPENFPFIVRGLKNGELNEVFGSYHSYHNWFTSLMGGDDWMDKDGSKDIYLVSYTPKIQWWDDLFAPGKAALKISPISGAAVESHYFREQKGHAVEIQPGELPAEVPTKL